MTMKECGETDGELPPKMLFTTYADTFQSSTHSKDNINQKYHKKNLIVLCIKNKYVLKLLKNY